MINTYENFKTMRENNLCTSYFNISGPYQDDPAESLYTWAGIKVRASINGNTTFELAADQISELAAGLFNLMTPPEIYLKKKSTRNWVLSDKFQVGFPTIIAINKFNKTTTDAVTLDAIAKTKKKLHAQTRKLRKKAVPVLRLLGANHIKDANQSSHRYYQPFRTNEENRQLLIEVLSGNINAENTRKLAREYSRIPQHLTDPQIPTWFVDQTLSAVQRDKVSILTEYQKYED